MLFPAKTASSRRKPISIILIPALFKCFPKPMIVSSGYLQSMTRPPSRRVQSKISICFISAVSLHILRHCLSQPIVFHGIDIHCLQLVNDLHIGLFSYPLMILLEHLSGKNEKRPCLHIDRLQILRSDNVLHIIIKRLSLIPAIILYLYGTECRVVFAPRHLQKSLPYGLGSGKRLCHMGQHIDVRFHIPDKIIYDLQSLHLKSVQIGIPL